MLGGGNSGAWQTPGRVSVVPGRHSCPAGSRTRFPPRCAVIATPSAAIANATPPMRERFIGTSTCQLSRQILRRDRLVSRLCVPEDRHNPPPHPVVVQLKAVDAAREWLAIRRALRVVRAERVQHGTECIGGAVNLAFEETLPLQAGAGC